MLAGDKKFTLDDMKTLAFDTYIVPAEAIVPLLEIAWQRAASEHPKLARAMELIKAWDRRSAEQSVAYTYIYFWGKSYQELFSEEKFARFISYQRKEKVDVNSREEQDRALEALEKAVGHVEKTYGKAEVPWGEINVVARGGKFPMDGSGLYDILHPDEGPEQDNGQMYDNDGWGHLLIVMEGSPKQVWSLLPYGESQHSSSPHYNDQAKLHSSRQAKPFWLTPADILAHTESVWGDRDRIRRIQ